MKVINVVGARPNFMKIGPILSAMRDHAEAQRAAGRPGIEQYLVHTGQHYDQQLSGLFFEQLGIPAPDVNLGVGSASHAVQTAEIMKRFEEVCVQQKPSHVLVVGDVNSTIACALVAAKLGIKVIHVEAGLRSFDRAMPEEINRVLTDAISDVLFTTEESANQNLLREGVPQERVHFVGNVMIDNLLRHRAAAAQSPILDRLGLKLPDTDAVPYGLLTLHRPATVDDPESLAGVLEAVVEVARDLPFVFPIHPRTASRAAAYGLESRFPDIALRGEGSIFRDRGIVAVPPLGYLEFLQLMSHARIVLTDSGGIQEETTILGVPCVTLRDSTERPVTVTRGTNVLAGVAKASILEHTRAQLQRPWPLRIAQPPLWDGRAAQRIVDVLTTSSA